MLEPLSYRGHWWLPDAPKRKIAGSLAYDPASGITLSLDGAFGHTAFDEQKFPVIIGHVYEHNQPTTLVDCFMTSSTISFPGFDRQVLAAHKAFIGGHILDPDNQRFSSCAVEFSGLLEWAGTSRIVSVKPGTIDDLMLGFGCRSVVEPTASLDGSVQLRITFPVSGSHSPPRTATLEQRAVLQLTSQAALTETEWASNYIDPLQNFFTLALDSHAPIVDVQLQEECTATADPIKVIFQQATRPTQRKHRIVREMLFSYHDIQGNMEDVLGRWMNLYRNIGGALDAVFPSAYRLSTYVELKFVSALHALLLLVLDLRTKSGSDAEEGLQFLETASVRRTLQTVLEEHQDVIGPLLPPPEDFLTRVMSDLYYVLRRKPQPGSDRPSARELYWTAEQLALLPKIRLLTELGFEPPKISELLARNPDIQHLATVARSM